MFDCFFRCFDVIYFLDRSYRSHPPHNHLLLQNVSILETAKNKFLFYWQKNKGLLAILKQEDLCIWKDYDCASAVR